jgi:SpoVK/Ycf46/Vps4 family AAA+-type ATPase
VELHRQAERLKEKGIALIKQGKLEEAKRALESALRKFKLAAEYSDGVAKEIRLEKVRECERLIRDIEGKLDKRYFTELRDEAREGEKEMKEKKAEVQKDLDKYESYIRSLMITREDKEKLPSWDDIGGLNEVKRKLRTYLVLCMIKDKPKAIRGDNILLYGPPGTGKTLLASAVARSLDATFFNVKISDLMSKYYGETSKIINCLFEVARKYAPSIIFIDEVDSILMRRHGELDEETRRAQSTLLANMDGLSRKGDEREVIVIGATNLIELIDPAFLRPGRFGIQIEVPLPDYEACKEIIKIHTVRSGVEIDESLIDELAKLCVSKGMSGADIKGMCMKAIWKMLEEMNPDLDKLADEPKEVIEKYRLKLRKLKREDFDV